MCIVDGDGNCGPRAIGVGVYGREEEHSRVRREVYNYMIDDYSSRGGV